MVKVQSSKNSMFQVELSSDANCAHRNTRPISLVSNTALWHCLLLEPGDFVR